MQASCKATPYPLYFFFSPCSRSFVQTQCFKTGLFSNKTIFQSQRNSTRDLAFVLRAASLSLNPWNHIWSSEHCLGVTPDQRVTEHCQVQLKHSSKPHNFKINKIYATDFTCCTDLFLISIILFQFYSHFCKCFKCSWICYGLHQPDLQGCPSTEVGPFSTEATFSLISCTFPAPWGGSEPW